MVCPKCDGKLKCLNTDPRLGGSVHRRYRCPDCKELFATSEVFDFVLAKEKASEKALEKPLEKVSEKALRKPSPEIGFDDFEGDEEEELDDSSNFDDEDLGYEDDEEDNLYDELENLLDEDL